jgi:hypothetical protein
MPIKVTFDSLEIIAQSVPTNEDQVLVQEPYAVARIHFTVHEKDGPLQLVSELKLTPGAPYGAGAIEVGRPVGYDARWQSEDFRKAAEKYLFGLVEPPSPEFPKGRICMEVGESFQITAVPVGRQNVPEAIFLSLQNVMLPRRRSLVFEVDDSSPAW